MGDLTHRLGKEIEYDTSLGIGGPSDSSRATSKFPAGNHPNSNHDLLVLIANDDHWLANSIAEGLEELGFKTLVAYDGNVALAMALAKQPDLMVLDTRMPQRSGYLVLEQVRLTGESVAPVIMLSDNEGNRHRQYAEMLGIHDFLEMPMETGKLIRIITDTISEIQ